jgi:hypothetical protein
MELITKAISLAICSMDKARFFILMVTFLMDSLNLVYEMAKVFTPIKMVTIMMGFGKMVLKADPEFFIVKNKIKDMRVNFIRVLNKALEHLSFLIKIFMKESLQMILWRGLVVTFGLMMIIIQVCLHKESLTAKEQYR